MTKAIPNASNNVGEEAPGKQLVVVVMGRPRRPGQAARRLSTNGGAAACLNHLFAFGGLIDPATFLSSLQVACRAS
jgi:hypothetical protein